jgi:hypothetical protein
MMAQWLELQLPANMLAQVLWESISTTRAVSCYTLSQ